MTSFPVADPQEVELAPAAPAPVQACEFVGRYLTQHHLAYLRDDVCRVVAELVSNALVSGKSRYGYASKRCRSV